MEYYDSYEECLNGYTKFLNEGDAGITNVYDLKDEINNCKILKRLHNLEKLTEYSI
jgi:flagellum-specific peptidoglycan hydrolase FlgJ